MYLNMATKQDSDYMIRRLGLNTVESHTFDLRSSSEQDVFNWLCTHKYEYYGMRDKAKSKLEGGMFIHKATPEEVLNSLKLYTVVGICESLYYQDKFNLVTQVQVSVDMDGTTYLEINDRSGISHREGLLEPRYSYKYNEFTDKRPSHIGLNRIFDYIYTNNLIGLCIECSLYDIPVGINRENIIVWELRNF